MNQRSGKEQGTGFILVQYADMAFWYIERVGSGIAYQEYERMVLRIFSDPNMAVGYALIHGMVPMYGKSVMSCLDLFIKNAIHEMSMMYKIISQVAVSLAKYLKEQKVISLTEGNRHSAE